MSGQVRVLESGEGERECVCVDEWVSEWSGWVRAVKAGRLRLG